ncbi:MAG: Uma2 family endonuclease [Hymenobacter sp.]|nr:MAG: Uma2 family endonuclease [Hymenobacter sp.]
MAYPTLQTAMVYNPSQPLVLRGLVTEFSDDEFFEFCQANSDLRLERNASGEIVIMTPAGFVSSAHSGEVVAQLRNWNKQYKLGRVADSSAGYTIPDKSTLSPDASWFSLAAWAKVPAARRRKFLPICPEFVVEVMSPSDTLAGSQANMEQWLQNGVQLGFLITDEPTEAAYIYRPGQPVATVLGFDNELSGEPVLAGEQAFQL